MGHTVLETVQVMVEHNIGAVPALHNGKLVGIFSERDLMIAAAPVWLRS
jgi:CBS domain-containing protein